MSEILERELRPQYLAVVDESDRHKGGAGAESHFNVVVVTTEFAQADRVARHRRVHALFAREFQQGLHALTLTLLTPEEWAARGGAGLESPRCAGGSQAR